METLTFKGFEMEQVIQSNLSSLTPDKRNANKGNVRGQAAIETSLQKYGAGRSIVLDRDGNIIAGNHAVEAASSIGMEDVMVVQTNGDKLVAVQRMDLSIDDPKAKELAIADNRTTQLSLTWDGDVLNELMNDPNVDISPFFTEMEVDFFTNQEMEESLWQEEAEENTETNGNQSNQVIVHCGNQLEVEELASKLEREGYQITVR
jgi:hypothetical protein